MSGVAAAFASLFGKLALDSAAPLGSGALCAAALSSGVRVPWCAEVRLQPGIVVSCRVYGLLTAGRPLPAQLTLVVRALLLAGMLLTNAVMLTCMVKALHAAGTLAATVAQSGVNFVCTVSGEGA